MQQTPRASSLVENLNSRLRNYFFASSTRSPVPELLKFFLNHRIFMQRVLRTGRQSPTELMTGQPHAHWLELLFRAVSTLLILTEKLPLPVRRC